MAGFGGAGNVLSIPVEKKKEEIAAPIFTDKDLEGWMTESDKIKSNICALLVGDPKVGKTGMALDCRTDEEKAAGMKIICIELNSDNGCKLNKKDFHKDDPSIMVLDPREFSINETSGDWEFDYIKTMAKIKALLMYIKKNVSKLNLKALVFDGADVFLSEVCEGQLRMDKHLDVAGGVQQLYWKIRNKYFYDVMNLIFTIDVDRYIITHFKEDHDTKKQIYSIQKDFPDKTHQILEFRKDLKTNKHYVKIVADRRNKPDMLNKEYCIMETDITTGKRIWNGFKL